MKRMLEIFLKFTRDTGHQHPNLMAAVNNYGALLMEMGNTKEEVKAKIGELMEKYGVLLE